MIKQAGTRFSLKAPTLPNARAVAKRLDDLTGTVFEGHPPAEEAWVLFVPLCTMSLNLSNRQIADELGLNKDDVQAMTQQLREVWMKKDSDTVAGVEFDGRFTSRPGTRATRWRWPVQAVRDAAAPSKERQGEGHWPKTSHPSSA